MDSLEYVTVEGGQTVFHEGDRGYCAYFIEKGAVEITVKRMGEDYLLARRRQGEIFGEMAILDDKPRSATVRALEDCTLITITQEQLARRIEASDPILKMCLNVILERYRLTMMQLSALSGEETRAPVGGEAGDPLTADDRHGRYDHAIQEIRLERELERALRQDDFELHFQPIVELDGGRIAGFEALVRWRHAERGLVPPVVFIPTAEASGFIVPLGRWCLREACAALRAFDASGPGRGLFMSVNITGRDFADPHFVDSVEQAVAETGVDPSRLKLEITESLLMHQPDQAIQALRACKEMGLSIAIDDFGTGYSSLSYLHRFPVDTLKIDQSFVSEMHSVPVSLGIIRTILGLAEQLDLLVVAEGIESERDAQTLLGLGCRYGQGYNYARPMTRDQAIALLAAG